MNYALTLNGKKFRVTVKGPKAELFSLSKGGESLIASFPLPEKTLGAAVRDGDAFFAKIGAAHFAGNFHREAQGEALAVSDGKIRSPFAGRITKIEAKNGDVLKENDMILVIEAMKMEYTVIAEAEGTLSDLTVTLGEQVTKDQVLGQIMSK